ncbi:immunity 22 family protein [Flavobacterium proteolyticum]|uniref:Immunity 22 family protein n=1 Tax=Flavobacterium proteolyticum TaxID=2911683 RepID=A0ABR9WUA1_9FLAO|nr:immunity 22 family protein [Flavobacterium proteolyticum]MBE9577219.1 immunity 22 family protein [Flavobacterium proteolyticum]
MGKYDGPYFETDNNVVSIWLAKTEYKKIPEDYWVENYEGEDDEAWNQFSNDFGFGSYNTDLVESFYDNTNFSKISTNNLLKFLSFSKSFIDAAKEKAEKLLIKESSYAYLIYNFEYDPLTTGITENNLFTFLGAFKFDKNSDSVEYFFNV